MSAFIFNESPPVNVLTNSKTLSANNTSANVAIFRTTGTVRYLALYGIVTTVLGANHTGGYFRLNDQTAQTDITLSTIGVTLSAFGAGSIIAKTALAATLATIKSVAAGRFYESATAGIPLLSEFYVTAKSGANTDIEYHYATTDAPTSGVIQFFCNWIPISADGNVTAL